jgi:hypothetical protein
LFTRDFGGTELKGISPPMYSDCGVDSKDVRNTVEVHEMTTLPDPQEARNHEFWEELQYEAYPPRKELGVYAKYTLGGTPLTWQERNDIKRNEMYQDVVVYANIITKRAT